MTRSLPAPLVAGRGTTPSAATGGQSTSRTPKVRLLSGHERPGLAVAASSRQPRPAVRGKNTRHPRSATRRARPGPAAGRDKPGRRPLWITRGQSCGYSASALARTNPKGSATRGSPPRHLRISARTVCRMPDHLCTRPWCQVMIGGSIHAGRLSSGSGRPDGGFVRNVLRAPVPTATTFMRSPRGG
jgi:hypothetical protein